VKRTPLQGQGRLKKEQEDRKEMEKGMERIEGEGGRRMGISHPLVSA